MLRRIFIISVGPGCTKFNEVTTRFLGSVKSTGGYTFICTKTFLNGGGDCAGMKCSGRCPAFICVKNTSSTWEERVDEFKACRFP